MFYARTSLSVVAMTPTRGAPQTSELICPKITSKRRRRAWFPHAHSPILLLNRSRAQFAHAFDVMLSADESPSDFRATQHTVSQRQQHVWQLLISGEVHTTSHSRTVLTDDCNESFRRLVDNLLCELCGMINSSYESTHARII